MIVKLFGDEETGSMKKASDLLTVLAKEYGADKIKKDDLKRRRDELMKEFGAAKSVTKKRPAAAVKNTDDDEDQDGDNENLDCEEHGRKDGEAKAVADDTQKDYRSSAMKKKKGKKAMKLKKKPLSEQRDSEEPAKKAVMRRPAATQETAKAVKSRPAAKETKVQKEESKDSGTPAGEAGKKETAVQWLVVPMPPESMSEEAHRLRDFPFTG